MQRTQLLQHLSTLVPCTSRPTNVQLGTLAALAEVPGAKTLWRVAAQKRRSAVVSAGPVTQDVSAARGALSDVLVPGLNAWVEPVLVCLDGGKTP